MNNVRRLFPAGALAWPWRACAAWLSRVPIDDAVDRRNAPMLQIVLILLGFVPPAMWLFRIFASAAPWRPQETASLLMSASLSAVAIFSLVLIRRGRFRWATRQLLLVVSVLVIASYAQSGFDAQAYEQPVQVVWIVVAGLVVGRWALWWMYGVHLLAFGIGVLVDLHSTRANAPHEPWPDQLVSMLISAVILLLIAVAVDRSVTALRESLRDAMRRGDDLARLNERLREEVAERERVRDQLVHAQKVEAVGRLAGGVAHDFNHLLSLMLGYAQRGRQAGDVAELRQALAGMESAARRAAAVAQTLLSFSRREASHVEVFDAGDALRELRPMLLQLFDGEVKVIVDAGGAPAPIAFDRAQFTLVVLNLAANANQAMPDGGWFHVRVRAAAAARVDIEFVDNGCGMTPDVQQRIFEPFFTTKPSGQGTGLGLAVAADLVRDVGGELGVRSAPGQGATFRMRLPLADAHAAVAASTSADAA